MAAPVIDTPRLLLRPWRESDFDAWTAMCIDPRVTEFLGVTYDRERADAFGRRLAERLERDGYGWWAVEAKDGGAFAGAILLQEIPFAAHFTPATEIGWWFAPQHWKRGYATEAARGALRFGFDALRRAEIVAITARINLRSQAVMERLGMVRNPAEDFDHPRIAAGMPLRRHVLYRMNAVSFTSEGRMLPTT